jgi:hypothetical protein
MSRATQKAEWLGPWKGWGVRVVKPRKRQTFAHSGGNSREVLTVETSGAVYTTSDPHDRAHDSKDPFGQLHPAADPTGKLTLGVQSRPRRYNRSQVVVYLAARKGKAIGPRAIGVDSMYDGWARAYRKLAAAGVMLGKFVEGSKAAAMADAMLPRGVELRDVLHQRTRTRMSPKELELERAASALLRTHSQ